VGFLSPLRLADRGMLEALFDRVVMRSRLRERDVFDYGFIADCVRRPRGWMDRGYLAFENLLLLHLWYERWMEGAGA
jgi:hypothetical protein